ncbi:MAG: TraM recognition domain-containing protein [Propionibacteriaceae bacterium]|nr:TraM recognition domain-containing protein [Propionibacteriaceae bacterium]
MAGAAALLWFGARALTRNPVAVTLIVTLGLVVISGTLLAVRRFWDERREASGHIPLGLATPEEIHVQAGHERLRDKALHQRPSLSEAEVEAAPLEDLGWYLGEGPDGTPIYAAMEDQILIYGKTGAGKDAYFAVPAVLSAPGPVVLTTTKADILDVIAGPRGRRGRIWVFDPLDQASWPDPMVWNCLRGCERDTVARARGKAFTAGIATSKSGNEAFFKDTAAAAIQYMMHAAALGDLTMRDVTSWAMNLDRGAETPQRIIRSSSHPLAEHLWADMLRTVSTGADDTVASTRVTLRGALDPISSGRVMDSLVPHAGAAEFDVHAFVESTDTLVLLSDANSLTNVAPLTTMLLQEVVDVGKEVARTKPRHLLDPPMRFVGNEIANVAPIPNLPEIYTDSRGYGMQWIGFVQSDTQLEAKWGPEGAGTLQGQAEFEIVLPGLKRQPALERFSALVGSVDVSESSASTSSAGVMQGMTTSTREQRILRPEEVRKLLGERSALVIPARGEPMILRLTPWWEGPEGAKLSAQAERVAAQRAATASARAKAVA